MLIVFCYILATHLDKFTIFYELFYNKSQCFTNPIKKTYKSDFCTYFYDLLLHTVMIHCTAEASVNSSDDSWFQLLWVSPLTVHIQLD